MTIAVTLVSQHSAPSGSVLATAGAITTGDTIVIAIVYDGSISLSSALSAFDNKSNTFVQASTTQTGSSKLGLYYCQNATGGADYAASLTFSGETFGTVYLFKITGAATASFDKANGGAPGGADPKTLLLPSAGSFSQANEAAVWICGGDGASSPTWSAGNAGTAILGQETDGGQFWPSCAGKYDITSTTAVTVSVDSHGQSNIVLVAASFREAAAGGGGVLRRRALSGGFEQMSGGMSG
jgi:hypothetical protein